MFELPRLQLTETPPESFPPQPGIFEQSGDDAELKSTVHLTPLLVKVPELIFLLIFNISLNNEKKS